MSCLFEDELRRIEEVWARAEKGGRVLILVGPDGSGKNLLIKNFSESMHIPLMYYRCEEREQNISLITIKRFAMVNMKSTKSMTMQKYWLFSRIIKELESSAPVIVHIANVNYSDTLSLKFIEYFTIKRPKNVLLVISYPIGTERRELTEILEKLIMEDYADVLVMGNLKPTKVREYLRRFGMEKYADEVYSLSGGNLELINLWITCKEHAHKSITTVEDGLRCIFESLSAKEREVLRVGSVMGNFFWEEVVNDIVNDTKQAIDSLLHKKLLTEFSSMYGSHTYHGYVFTNPRLRRYIYTTMDLQMKRNYHFKVAESIRRRRIYRRWERTYELASHYISADSRKKALPYLKRCVEMSKKDSDYNSMIFHLKHFERCLNSYNNDAERVWLYHLLSDSLQHIGDVDTSLKYADKLASLAKIQKSIVLKSSGKFEDAINLCDEVISKNIDSFLTLKAYGVESECYRRLGLYKKAYNIQKHHISLAEKLQNLEELATGYKNMGNILMDMMRHPEGKEYYLKALKLFRQLRNLNGISAIYNNLGIYYSNEGDKKKALEYYKKSLKLDEKLNDYEGMGTSYNNIGTVYLAMGNIFDAMEAYRKSAEYNNVSGNIDGLCYAYSNIASLLMRKGDFKGAIEYISKVLTIAKNTGSIRFTISGYLALSIIEMYHHRFRDAIIHAKKALDLGKESNNIYDAADAYFYVAKASYFMNKKTECVSLAEKALEIYRKLGIEDRASHIYGLLSRCDSEYLPLMKQKIKIYSPEDSWELLMSEILVKARNNEPYSEALEALEKEMRENQAFAQLHEFLEELYQITKDPKLMPKMKELSKSFKYVDENKYSVFN
ncbi:MAG: tetratricopeptide repeat protein [Euryarchaeota archaeon]|nr:tetratricopeptide repeat protein [Euryarchaeota archaeon]